MKVMIVSDLHGSAYYTRKALEIFQASSSDLLAILGDVYNHGPRNPLPQEYAPMEVARLLNSIKDKLLVVKGNCDSEVDSMISEFHFVESAALMVGSNKVYLTHGHVFNKDNLPALSQGDTLIYGHFHQVICEEVSGVHILNPGSISLPKDGLRAYIMLDEKGASIFDLDGKELYHLDF